MLVLERKAGEKIVISGGIVITALGIRNGKLRIGVEAPAHVVVDRLEVDEAKKREPRSLD